MKVVKLKKKKPSQQKERTQLELHFETLENKNKKTYPIAYSSDIDARNMEPA